MRASQVTPSLRGDSIDEQRTALLSTYHAVRAMTEAFAAPLTTEDCMVQSMPTASPAKWHLGHTAWFFDAFVLARQPGYRPYDSLFSAVFGSSLAQPGAPARPAHQGALSRPSLHEVRRYRAFVDEQITDLLERASGDELTALAPVFSFGVNHEQQHQEMMLADVKHAFYSNPARPAYAEDDPPKVPIAPPRRTISYPEGLHEIGHAGDGFAFDNERPRHPVVVPAFRLATRLATNLEYMEFIADHGYQRSELWLPDGWDAVREEGWRAPLYWEEKDGTWWHMTLHGMTPVPIEAPVGHVSYYEADAFTRWAGARLPTEVEWEVAAAELVVEGNFVESGVLAPLPPPRLVETEPQQMFGDLWEWTSSNYAAYPGYRPAPAPLGALGGGFMCNRMVLRGGSCVTPADLIRPTYRSYHEPRARWLFAGIRMASGG